MIACGKHCAETGKIFVTNLSAPFLCQFFKAPMLAVMPYTDYVFGNETECAAFGEANGMAGACAAGVWVVVVLRMGVRAPVSPCPRAPCGLCVCVGVFVCTR
jgi:sugar/nucleoside kinase (ribokinase family)